MIRRKKKQKKNRAFKQKKSNDRWERRMVARVERRLERPIFKQVGITTGRTSSFKPNIANIPLRTTIGKQVREAFSGPHTQDALDVDYEAFEKRLLETFKPE